MHLPRSETHSRVATIVREVADRKGVDFTDLPPLYDEIDPEALETLADSLAESQRGEIRFTYCGYDVLIDSDGHVIVGNHSRRETQPSHPKPMGATNEDGW